MSTITVETNRIEELISMAERCDCHLLVIELAALINDEESAKEAAAKLAKSIGWSVAGEERNSKIEEEERRLLIKHFRPLEEFEGFEPAQVE